MDNSVWSLQKYCKYKSLATYVLKAAKNKADFSIWKGSSQPCKV